MPGAEKEFSICSQEFGFGEIKSFEFQGGGQARSRKRTYKLLGIIHGSPFMNWWRS